MQQFVLQHHIGRPERILGVPAPGVPAPGVPAPGVPAPAVELANRHVVAPRPKSLDKHPVVDVPAGHGPKRRPPDLDAQRHFNFVLRRLVSHSAIGARCRRWIIRVRTGFFRGGADDPNET